jgi:hypothetical protein
VTNENWQEVLELKIKAKIDKKYDGDQIRICNVFLKQIYQLQVVKMINIGKVTVCVVI